MTIALQLDSTDFAALREEAAGLGVTPEQLANDIVRRHTRARGAAGGSADDPVFRAAMAATLAEHEELFRRLAK